MNEEKFSFNLITEPWIPCRMRNETATRIEYLGIEDVLLQAHDIREISGESPPVTISLYRLLLAVLHRCYGPLSFHGEWKEVWQSGAGSFAEERIKTYLRQKSPIDLSARFDLFDETHPFYQSVKAPTTADDNSIGKLFFKASDTLFEHSTKECPPEFSFAQAARWLVTYQAFDFGGTKSGRDEQKYAQSGRLIQTAVALARGQNIFQTLMLNLYWDDKPFFTSYGDQPDDKPAWEREDSVDWKTRPPTGHLDLLTWQSRCVKLGKPQISGTQRVVKEAFAFSGFKLPENYELNDKETMIAFAPNKTAKGARGFFPINFRKERALWRDSYAIFHAVQQHPRQHSMQLLNWLANLAYVGVLEDERVVPIDFYGLTHEKKNIAKLLFWRHERLPLSLHYLQDDDLCRELNAALKLAEGVAGLLAAAIHRFAALICIPNNDQRNREWFIPLPRDRAEADKLKAAEETQKKLEKDSKRDKDIAGLRKGAALDIHYWPRLESEFRRLLIALARSGSDWPALRTRWVEAMKRAAEQSFREIITSTGDSTRTLRATALAQTWFEARFGARKYRYLNSHPAALDDGHFEEEPETDDDTDDEDETGE